MDEKTLRSYAYDLDRRVMQDMDRPCLFHVAGPCFHPKCLEAHCNTIQDRLDEAARLDITEMVSR